MFQYILLCIYISTSCVLFSCMYKLFCELFTRLLSLSYASELMQITKYTPGQANVHFRLVIRGDRSDSAVLCTDSHTYDVREAETSNGLLLMPSCELGNHQSQAQSNSTMILLHKQVLQSLLTIVCWFWQEHVECQCLFASERQSRDHIMEVEQEAFVIVLPGLLSQARVLWDQAYQTSHISAAGAAGGGALLWPRCWAWYGTKAQSRGSQWAKDILLQVLAI